MLFAQRRITSHFSQNCIQSKKYWHWYNYTIYSSFFIRLPAFESHIDVADRVLCDRLFLFFVPLCDDVARRFNDEMYTFDEYSRFDKCNPGVYVCVRVWFSLTATLDIIMTVRFRGCITPSDKRCAEKEREREERNRQQKSPNIWCELQHIKQNRIMRCFWFLNQFCWQMWTSSAENRNCYNTFLHGQFSSRGTQAIDSIINVFTEMHTTLK